MVLTPWPKVPSLSFAKLKAGGREKRVLGEEAVGIRMVDFVLEMFQTSMGPPGRCQFTPERYFYSRERGRNSRPKIKAPGFGLLFIVKSENTSGHEKERVVKSESADATFHDDGDDDDDDDDECGSGRGSRRIREMSSEEDAKKNKNKKLAIKW